MTNPMNIFCAFSLSPIQAVFIGMMISSSLWGNISDKYGRKTVSSTNTYILHGVVSHNTSQNSQFIFGFICKNKKETKRKLSALDSTRVLCDHHDLFSSLLCSHHMHTQGLKMSVLWTMFYGVMSAFAPIYGWILVLRALVGFGIGGAPQS